MRKGLVYILSAMLVFMCACSPNGGDDGVNGAYEERNSISVGVYNFDTYNPIATVSDSVAQTSALIYDSLIKQNEDFGIEMLLCKDYTVSNGGLCYTFNLRDDVKWHDGSEFSARDVEYTFDAIANAEFCAYKGRMENIESYMRNGKNQFIINLYSADGGFINSMDIPIIKRGTDCVDGLKEYIPIGTGMYKYTDSDLSRAIKLVRNEDYILSEKPLIEEVIIKQLPNRDSLSRALETREIDIAHFSAEEMRNYNPKGSLAEVSFSNNTLMFIGINATVPGLDSALIRRAMSYSLSRDDMSKNLLFGRAEAVWVPVAPQSHLHKPIYSFTKDKQRAIQLLNGENYAPNENGTMVNAETGRKLSFEIIVNEKNNIRVAVAEKIKSDLAQIGVYIKVTKLSFNDYRARVLEGEYDMYVGEVEIGDDLNLAMFAGVSARYSIGSSERFSKLNNRIRYASDYASFVQTYGELCETYLEEVSIIPVAMETDAVVFNKKIKNVTPPYYGSVFANMSSWYVDYVK